MTIFSIVPPEEWRLDSCIGRERRARLSNTPFEAISEQIAEVASCAGIAMESLDDHPGSNRARVGIELPAELVDLFHNGATGYRAQFYLSPDLGEAANRHILNRLLGPITEWGQGLADWQAIGASLRHTDAKVWIREGTWFEDSKEEDLHLTVLRWRDNAEKMTKWPRFEPHWARVTPKRETILEIKGGCVDGSGKPQEIVLKPDRAVELNEHGFT